MCARNKLAALRTVGSVPQGIQSQETDRHGRCGVDARHCGRRSSAAECVVPSDCAGIARACARSLLDDLAREFTEVAQPMPTRHSHPCGVLWH